MAVFLADEQVAEALGAFVPRANVLLCWPLVASALERFGIFFESTAIAAAATIVAETGNFLPQRERGSPAYLTALYENRRDLGNTEPGDGARFAGRGFVQITGRWNYAHFGREIGVDLVANPAAALSPNCAALILACFFKERAIPDAANLGDWQMVRRRINGGMNAWGRFSDAVAALGAAVSRNPPAPAEAT